MFSNPFSFNGRIRRLEYGLSYIIYTIFYFVIMSLNLGSEDESLSIIPMIFIPIVWFLLAQSAKRCHDLGKSGWWQIIPFYLLWMIFKSGDCGSNEYGESPKGLNFVGDIRIEK